jgi:tungstate transport system substrate-binding protein
VNFFHLIIFAVLSMAVSSMGIAGQKNERLIIQSTSSVENSGLYGYILPVFKKKTGISVHVIAVGSGQAVANVMRGDGDILLIHDKQKEEQFIASGYGIERFDVMYNFFEIVGLQSDPAGVIGAKTAGSALARIARNEYIFVSRGDESGTHIREKEIWASAAFDAEILRKSPWYRESGVGMGATLNIAIALDGYTLTDNATWLNFNNKQSHTTLFDKDPVLFNQYGIIMANPEKHPHMNKKAAEQFLSWILSKEGQELIASYKTHGEQVFFPNATADFVANMEME